MLEKVALASIREQRARRRWGIFFKLAFLAYFVVILFVVMGFDLGLGNRTGDTKFTALVNLNGTIDSAGENSAERINQALRSAFEDKTTAGVILRINSPGGSPVQSGIIFDEIKRLREKYPEIPLYAVVEDVCASGGYYVAAAADRIFVDKASIIGSIGVLMDGFGFTGIMDKLGVERRLLTSGENKGFLDPFSPQNEKQVEHMHNMLAEIHTQFIDMVRKGRGDRLKESPDMFSGFMWTGSQSIAMGLADGYGTVDNVARELIKAETILDYSLKENIAERFARRFGTQFGESFSLRLLEGGESPKLR